MALTLFHQIFCGCCHSRDEIEGLFDETSHLIPENVDPPVTYGSDGARVDHEQLHERLENIVRTKEGKMVNVASHIPFNLHNRVIPAEPHSISRSASGSMDTREERRYNPYYDYHQRGDSDQQPRSKFTTSGYPYGEGPPTRSPSVSSALLPGPSHETRNRPRYEQPRPTPILNVRLVGYSETRTRGRARERGPASEDPASSGNNEDGSENRAPTVEVRSETDELTPIQQSALIKIHEFKPADTIPITVSWSD
ncbi:hypothetical protein CVT26_012499 [Gymnopilus dilepis]|uniref:Uncharacterized protein n=1 Tax=Gymnopilus dilepis TaxID=231916 RepID=A0A409YW60_9AGAR|nr:hypothetical protein CVT26_012499 [Gymnopilus dilepis]